MTDIFWRRFRDLSRPNPEWEEQAYYGGYRWIELTQDFWLSRMLENETRMIVDLLEGKQISCNYACIGGVLQLLQEYNVLKTTQVFSDGSEKSRTFGKLLEGRYFLKNQRYKFTNVQMTSSFLRKQKVLIAIGESEGIQKLIREYSYKFTDIYTTFYCSGNARQIGVAEAIELSNSNRIVISSSEESLKQDIINWANIAVL